MPESIVPDEVMRKFNELSTANDRLGLYSDHEGDEAGSTFYFWNQGSDVFASQVARAIADHKSAINLWTELAMLNYEHRERKVMVMP